MLGKYKHIIKKLSVSISTTHTSTSVKNKMIEYSIQYVFYVIYSDEYIFCLIYSYFISFSVMCS